MYDIQSLVFLPVQFFNSIVKVIVTKYRLLRFVLFETLVEHEMNTLYVMILNLHICSKVFFVTILF